MTNRQKNHLVMYIYIKSKSNDFPNIIQKETYRHAGYLRGFGLFLFFGVESRSIVVFIKIGFFSASFQFFIFFVPYINRGNSTGFNFLGDLGDLGGEIVGFYFLYTNFIWLI